MNNEGRRKNCPYCNSDHYVLDGVFGGQQTYECRDCGRGSGQRGAVGGHSYIPDQIGMGIKKFFEGRSARSTAKLMNQLFSTEGTSISPQTILNWAHRYTGAAVKLIKGCQVSGGGKWWLWSQPFPRQSWMWWMVVDEATGYIIASHVSTTMTEDGAREVLLEALASAERPCDEVVYWMYPPKTRRKYDCIPEEAILKVMRGMLLGKRVITHTGGFPPFSSAPVVAKVVTLLASNHLFNSINDHDNVQLYTAGAVITSNFLFTKLRELRGRTPAQAAGVKAPFTDWVDVVRLEAKAHLPSTDA